jgi:hypothetical protein
MKSPELPAFDYTPKPYTGLSAEEVFALRKQFLNPALILLSETDDDRGG